MTDRFSATVSIHAAPADVWHTLTVPERMQAWIAPPEMGVTIDTDWTVHSPITIQGYHHLPFENRGTILACEQAQRLRYSQLSSLSRLADRPENYSILEFILAPVESGTILTVNLENFPTEVIRKHLVFYWNTALAMIKKATEQHLSMSSPL